MKLFNTLTKQIEDFKPLEDKQVRIYSCGPTVYDHIHIGNLASFVYADTLRRALEAAGFKVEHVMNITDVDDKTIKRSKEKYPDLDPKEALTKLTREYEGLFMKDLAAIGNGLEAVKFVRATDSIEQMQELIRKLHKDGFAYIADDGLYFSISKYQESGKAYGQLTKIDAANTSQARIQNDEYDKESAHDFALWKLKKEGEPAWPFELDGKQLEGRPGWHIECSAMSVGALGQPFDIHTGGIDLVFPHHENEIAQSTAGQDNPLMAKLFFHNEHLLVDGKKMSKSLNNFYTLEDVTKKGFDPLAFRLLVLQSHYRKQSNFTWEALEAAQNRLSDLRAAADALLQQGAKGVESISAQTALENDLDLPSVLTHGMSALATTTALGLQLDQRAMPTGEQQKLLDEREAARAAQDWTRSDELRDQLKAQGIEVRDTDHGQVWTRV